jgi:hypothetical protein
MAVVVLDRLCIHLASDLSQYVEADTDGQVFTPQVAGEVRRYANGVERMVRTPGNTKTANLRFDFLNRADAIQLEEWCGVLVMVRTETGDKEWGVFFAAPRDDTAGVEDDNGEAPASVNVEFRRVTYSEIV